jgi:hypothetical protein
MEPAALVLPTQLPACQPVPVTIPILSLVESFANAVVAFVYAESQSDTARFSLCGTARKVSKHDKTGLTSIT